MRKIRVLIVDDSALVREILTKGLSQDGMIEVVGTASDVYAARTMIVELQPDVVTLDIEMPKMDGLEFLKRLMPQFPIPVVVVSSLTNKEVTLRALSLGAVDFVSKPVSDVSRGLISMIGELRAKIAIAANANVSHWKNKRFELEKELFRGKKTTALAQSTDKVIAIGASTGGTEAIKSVITNLPPGTTPGIVIVQHIPSGFSRTFADRLNELAYMQVKEAEPGDRVVAGRVLVAPGGYHMKVKKYGGHYLIETNQNDKVNGHRPSVDVLFESVAENVGANAIGVILTGMGGDGAKGLKKMRDAGARTIGQDKASSVVYGMPKVAHELGGVEIQLPLNRITELLVKWTKE